MPQAVPLQAIPNQTLQVQLNNQACILNVVQFAFGLFITIYVGTVIIIAGVICRDRTRIVRNTYLGFNGDFIFMDTQGTNDPDYTGLGGATARYQILYLTQAEAGDT
jgi:hypothetical protein